MTNPESKAAAPTYWCCSADFGKHDKDCPNRKESAAAKLLGRKGGLSRSPAKVRAAKENGKKGGKPKLNISPDMQRRGYTGEPINK